MSMVRYSQKSLNFIHSTPQEDAFVTILDGSVRSGKTYTMIPKLFRQLITYDVPGDRVFFGKSKETIYNNVLTTIFDIVGRKNYSYNRTSGELFLYDQRWRVVGAKDDGSEQYIRGATIGIALGDELVLTPKTFWDMMLSRLSPEGARLYGTTNPDSPYHHLYVDWVNNEEKKRKGLVKVIQFNMDDNLSLSEEKKEQFRGMYKGVFHKRMIQGIWCVTDGAIYKDCYEDSLLYDESDVTPILRGEKTIKHIAIDYGTGNPTVFLLIIDDGTTYWVDREYYYNSNPETGTGIQKTDKQYVKDLIKFRDTYTKNAQCIVDPSAASLKAEMIQNGVWLTNAKNEVLDGIRTVSSLLGQRKIRIHKRCVKLIDELQSYAWDKNKAAIGEDAPIKKHDHAPDALRYFCETKVPKWRISA